MSDPSISSVSCDLLGIYAWSPPGVGREKRQNAGYTAIQAIQSPYQHVLMIKIHTKNISNNMPPKTSNDHGKCDCKCASTQAKHHLSGNKAKPWFFDPKSHFGTLTRFHFGSILWKPPLHPPLITHSFWFPSLFRTLKPRPRHLFRRPRQPHAQVLRLCCSKSPPSVASPSASPPATTRV